MKLAQERRRIEVSESEESFAFGFKVTAKSFDLLISKLYADSVTAFIRELSTNAYEAHQMLGIESEPFDVTLPTLLNPQFKIRDYGPGLSVEDVRKVYVMLFESTKTDSNDMGGCFGLGSKSPFAYHHDIQFTVTSYYGGKKYMYSLYRDKHGFPFMDLMQTVDSNERTGIEISIPIKREDHKRVNEAARWIYGWFLTTPRLTNNERPFTKNTPTLVGDKYDMFSNISYPHVKMGNIVYPIDSNKCDVETISRCGIVLNLNIGDVQPQPSRDALHYDNKTISVINNAAKKVVADIISRIQPKIDACQDYYDAMIIGENVCKNSPINVNMLSYKNERLSYRYLINGDVDSVLMSKIYKHGKLTNYMKGPDRTIVPTYDVNPKFIVVDTKCHYLDIIKQNISDGDTVYICNITYKKHDISKFCSALKINPARLINIKTLPYNPKVKAKSSRIKHVAKCLKYRYNSSIQNSWEDANVDDNEKHVYVPIKNNRIMVNGREIHPSSLQKVIDFISYDKPVYGVRINDVEKMKSKGWMNFLDVARKNITRLTLNVNEANITEASLIGSISQSVDGYSSIDRLLAFIIDGNISVKNSQLLELLEITKIQTRVDGSKLEFLGAVNRLFYHNNPIKLQPKKAEISHKKYSELMKYVYNKYPLIHYLRAYNINKETAIELVKYINNC